jgi:hypothetical protein
MPSKKFEDDEDDEKIILAAPKNRILIERKRKRQQTKKPKRIIEDEVAKVTKLCESFDPVYLLFFCIRINYFHF